MHLKKLEYDIILISVGLQQIFGDINGRNKTIISFEQHIETYSGAIMKHIKKVNK